MSYYHYPCLTCRLVGLRISVEPRDVLVIQCGEMAIRYHFQSLHGGDVDEGDSGEVQDEAVDVHPGDLDVAWKISVPVHPEVKVLHVSGHIQRINVQGTERQVFLFRQM